MWYNCIMQYFSITWRNPAYKITLIFKINEWIYQVFLERHICRKKFCFYWHAKQVNTGILKGKLIVNPLQENCVDKNIDENPVVFSTIFFDNPIISNKSCGSPTTHLKYNCWCGNDFLKIIYQAICRSLILEKKHFLQQN